VAIRAMEHKSCPIPYFAGLRGQRMGYRLRVPLTTCGHALEVRRWLVGTIAMVIPYGWSRPRTELAPSQATGTLDSHVCHRLVPRKPGRQQALAATSDICIANTKNRRPMSELEPPTCTLRWKRCTTGARRATSSASTGCYSTCRSKGTRPNRARAPPQIRVQ
jgi:hypothetical protein